MATLPELTTGPLVIWRLRGVDKHELVCEVRSGPDALGLRLYDAATGWELVCEPHSDVESLVCRSYRMLDTCLAEGWRELCGEDATVGS
jgi:hypothetical protein